MEFEWENKVCFQTLQCASMVTTVITQITVNTNIVELNEYLEQLVKCTNMKCLTPKEVVCLVTMK